MQRPEVKIMPESGWPQTYLQRGHPSQTSAVQYAPEDLSISCEIYSFTCSGGWWWCMGILAWQYHSKILAWQYHSNCLLDSVGCMGTSSESRFFKGSGSAQVPRQRTLDLGVVLEGVCYSRGPVKAYHADLGRIDTLTALRRPVF